jgi:hypothetical protein
MDVGIVKTHTITIFIAGDIGVARYALRRFAYEYGACFTITPTEFVYTGGEEAGVAIGLVNYPRFPSTVEWLWDRAERLAKVLMPVMNQRTCLLVGTDETRWCVEEPPGSVMGGSKET